MLTKVKPAFQLHDLSLLRQQCYIDGKWVDADGKKTLAVHNPADGQQIGTVPSMGVAETRRAIEAANAAWPAWRARTAKERSNILRKWFELVMANQEDLAVIMTIVSTPRLKARWHPNSATPARPAFAPTGFSCRKASTKNSRKSSGKRSRR